MRRSGCARTCAARADTGASRARGRQTWLTSFGSGSPIGSQPGRALDTGSHIGGQLQIDVLERRPSHAQLLQVLPTRECLTRELVECARGIVRLELDKLPG